MNVFSHTPPDSVLSGAGAAFYVIHDEFCHDRSQDEKGWKGNGPGRPPGAHPNSEEPTDQSDGFVRGEGVGLVVLRRLGDADTDQSRIFATVEATAVNQDGGTGTITAPMEAMAIKPAIHSG